MSVIKRILSTTLRQFSVLLICACSLSSTAQANPELVADIAVVPTAQGSNPRDFFTAENLGLVLFTARTIQTGRELWATDGTDSWLVKDIIPGSQTPWFYDDYYDDTSFDPKFIAVGSHVYFWATSDTLRDVRLWKTDGTSAGTVMVTERIAWNIPFYDGSYFFPNPNFTAVGNFLFFVDQQGGLWKSDGTEAGTEVVKDFTPNGANRGATIGALAAIGNLLYFYADDGVHGRELWKSDGTESGTVLVYDVNPGAGHNIDYDFYNSEYPYSLPIVTHGDHVYFYADDGTHGIALWASDGTDAGTFMVKGTSGVPQNLIVVSDTLYFAANGLWKVEGTDTEPVLVKAYNSTGGNGVYNSTAFNNMLYFTLPSDGVNGGVLWKSDGTVNGTVQIKDVGSRPRNIKTLDKAMYFITSEGLWKSDGTAVGTVLFEAINQLSWGFWGNNPLAVIGDELYFSVEDGVYGRELWKSDGTDVGTFLFKNIQSDAAHSNPASFVKVNGLTYFTAETAASGRELWASDGSTTWQVKDINPGSNGISYSWESNYFNSIGNTLYFIANDGVNGRGIWKTDGTEKGTLKVKDGVSSFEVVGTTLFFAHDRELWKTDGVTTTMVSDVKLYGSRFKRVNSLFYFFADDGVHGLELWKTDGINTSLVKDIRPGSDGSFNYSYSSYIAVGNTLYFSVDDGIHGLELWKSDGTEEGTKMVKNIVWQDASSTPEMIASVGDTLFFAAGKQAYGRELWKTDGTAAGTVMVKDMNPGQASSFDLYDGSTRSRVVGNKLYFETPSQRTEWVSDGTEAGTMRLRDVNSGNELNINVTAVETVGNTAYAMGYSGNTNDGSAVYGLWKLTNSGAVLVKQLSSGIRYELSVLVNKLYFVVADEAFGEEIWVSDGTEAGTQLLFDLVPGPLGSSPEYLTVSGNSLYFSADDGVHGQEPWRYELPLTVGTGEMGDYVWRDMNGDGVQDSSEPGLADVSIDLLSCTTGAVVDSLTSGPYGGYRFTQIPEGQYQMRYLLPSGYRYSPAGQGGDYRTDSNADDSTGIGPCVSIKDGQQRLALDVGMIKEVASSGTGIIGDYVWNDLNGNGVQDNSESGLADVSIDLLSCIGSLLDSTITNAAGNYRFDQLAVGSYQLRYHLPTGYRYSPAGQGSDYRKDSNADEATGLGPCLPMRDNQQRLAIDVGMVPDNSGGTGSMGDYVWHDVNRNGVQDTNESGLANVIVDLQSCNGTLIESTTTDASGQFKFTGMAAGDYRMKFNLPSGYQFSPVGQGGNYRTDSNANRNTGFSPCLSIDNQQRNAIDAGMM